MLSSAHGLRLAFRYAISHFWHQNARRNAYRPHAPPTLPTNGFPFSQSLNLLQTRKPLMLVGEWSSHSPKIRRDSGTLALLDEIATSSLQDKWRPH